MRKVSLNLADMPQIQVPDKIFSKGFRALYKCLHSNLAPPLGDHSDIWARPAPRFPGAYFWDSSFIAQAWKLWDPTIGFRILKPFVEFQAKNGRMPHNIFWGRKVGALSNPPFLAWAVHSLLEYHPEEKQASFFLKPLIKFVQWRNKHRFNEENQLFFWEHSYESGIDNSPRYTSRDESEDYGTKDLGAIDLNSEIVLQQEAIIRIIEQFGQESAEKENMRNQMEDLVQNIEKKLWNAKDDLFGDLDFSTSHLKTKDTIASYFPLILPDLSESKEKILLKKLKAPQKYNTLIPTPTVALDSPEFVKDMWRGPVWINTSFLVVQGLKRREYSELAGDFAYRLCKGVYHTWENEGSFFEFYDPERYDLCELSRKKGNLFKKITLGSKPVKNFAGWTADVNTLLIEYVIGLFKEQNQWKIEPHLPKEWIQKGNVMKLTIPFYQVSLQIEIQENQGTLAIKFLSGEKKKSLEVNNHEGVNLSF